LNAQFSWIDLDDGLKMWASAARHSGIGGWCDGDDTGENKFTF
jgi:hypothetical protein